MSFSLIWVHIVESQSRIIKSGGFDLEQRCKQSVEALMSVSLLDSRLDTLPAIAPEFHNPTRVSSVHYPIVTIHPDTVSTRFILG